MPGTGETIALIGGGLLATEATGITNVTPIGSGGGGDGGGGSPGPTLPPGLGIPPDLFSGLGLGSAFEGIFGSFENFSNTLETQTFGPGEVSGLVTDVTEQFPDPSDFEIDVPDGFDPGNIGPVDYTDLPQLGPNLGPGGLNLGGPSAGGPSGDGDGDSFDNPAPGIQLGDVPALVSFLGEGTGATGSAAGGFIAENPYAVGGTALGAISPDPITTGIGAAAGGATEVTADFLTGGTPLGVQSPANFLSPDTYINAATQAGDLVGAGAGATADVAGAGFEAVAGSPGTVESAAGDVAYGAAGAAGDVVAGTGEAIFGPAVESAEGSGGDPRTAVTQAADVASPIVGGAANVGENLLDVADQSGGSNGGESAPSPTTSGRANRQAAAQGGRVQDQPSAGGPSGGGDSGGGIPDSQKRRIREIQRGIA